MQNLTAFTAPFIAVLKFRHIFYSLLLKVITVQFEHVRFMPISWKAQNHSKTFGSLVRFAMRLHRYESKRHFVLVLVQCSPTDGTDVPIRADFS